MSQSAGSGRRAGGRKSPDLSATTGNSRGGPRKKPEESAPAGNVRGTSKKTPATKNGRGRKTPNEPTATGNGRGRKTPNEPAATGNCRRRKTPDEPPATAGNGRGRKTPDGPPATGNGRGRKTPNEPAATGNGRGRKTPDKPAATGNGRGRKTPDEPAATGNGRSRKTPDEPAATGNGRSRKTPNEPAATATGNGKGFQRKLEKAMGNLVRVRQTDKSETSTIYNPIVDRILKGIKKIAVNEGESDIFRLRQLNSGSYFENLKVDTTNEFDFMFCIYGQELVLKETEPSLGMVAVKLPKSNDSSLRKYLTPDGFLSPKKLLNRFRGLVEQAIDTLSRAGADSPFKGLQFELMRQKDGCPAVTLMVAKRRLQISIDLVLALELPAPWPKCTHGWKDGVTRWPDSRDIRAIKNNELHLVAKAAPRDKDPGGNTLWRLSFSQTEKEIFSGQILSPTDARTSNHATTCRKDCLRCLKYIKYKLQLTGGVARNIDFASYHLKTVLLHAIVKQPGGWENENLVTCLVYVIDELVKCISNRHLPHFFIPGYNLFDPAIFNGLKHLSVVKDQFLRVKEDLMNERLPEELDALAMSVH
ncbi:MB21D1 [Branchiostoma lanceolatum]|uniref:MB21D1 protein n=1 Tax=Branchiostoma lanceolatum TaxID=7740 RepID=A0A8J9W3E8_BRALA|nr:MB21D1 [Branchiostoma lanceolatum]